LKGISIEKSYKESHKIKIMKNQKSTFIDKIQEGCWKNAEGSRLIKLLRPKSVVATLSCLLYSLLTTVQAASQITPYLLSPISANVDSSNTNTYLQYSPRYIDFKPTITGGTNLIALTKTQTSNGNGNGNGMGNGNSYYCELHVVNFIASVSGKMNCPGDIQSTNPFTVLKEAGSGSTSDMQIFVTQPFGTRTAYLYRLQISTTIAINNIYRFWSSLSGSDFLLTVAEMTGTNYILLLEYNNNYHYFAKLDIKNFGNGDIYQPAMFTWISAYNPKALMMMGSSNTWALAHKSNGDSIYIFDTTSLSLLKDYWKENGFSNLAVKHNNLNIDEIYRAGNLNNKFYFQVFDVSTSSFNLLRELYYDTSTRSIAQILNFGSFNYVALALNSVSASSTVFSFYDKTQYYFAITLSTDPVYKSDISQVQKLMSEGRIISTKEAGIVLASSNANNFQSYNVVFGCCTPDASGICAKPNPPMYFTSTSPTYECDNYWYILDAFGMDTTTYQKAACGIDQCWDCRDDTKQCRACNDGYVWVNVTTGGPNQCVLPIDLPNSFGKKDISYTDRIPVVTKSVSAYCNPTHCLVCKDDYMVCSACDVSAGYFLNETTGTCVNTFADTFGPNFDTGKADSCADPNCKTCNTNVKICTSCLNSPSTYYLYKGSTVDSKCLQTSEFPAGYAVSGTNAVPCDPSKNCATCMLTNYQKCTSCTVGSLYFYYAANNTCITVDYIPATYGVDTTTNIVKQCNQYPDCKLCQKSYTECTSCDYTTRNMYLELSTSQCILNTALGVGRGPNTTNGTVTDCQDPNCDNCKTDFQVCTVCLTANKYYLDTSTGLCVKDVDITAGKGANLVTKQVDTCTSTGCIDCRTDITICSVCNTTLFYYLDTVTKKCVLTSNIPNTFGANTVTGNIDMCTLPHCLQCQQDYSQCITCDYSTGWYYDANLQVCVEVKDISSYVGACSKAGGSCVQGTVSQCTQTGCLLCQADNTVCSSCDKNSGYYMKDPAVNASMATCTLYSDLPGGIGADVVSGKVKKCSDPGCLKCQDNYQQCGLCNNATTPPYYLNPLNEQCTLEKDITDGFGVNKATNMIESCADIHCVSCVNNFSVCVKCDTNTLYYLDSATASCVNFADIPNGFGPNLDPFPSPNPKFGVIQACQKDKCLFCQNDYSVCTGCDMSKDTSCRETTRQTAST
jgi:hypothetical protein